MNVTAFVIATVLFIGGIVLFGYSFNGVEFFPLLFIGGLLAISVSIAVPYHVLKRLDG